MMPEILVITGPTATGKTELGIKLARCLDGEIVSADSMQIYRYMDIGTAKPTKEEMNGIPHHMIDVVEPQEPYSVARYVKKASECVDDILLRGKIPIIVGGTGLYIDSLLSGRSFAEGGGEDDLREKLSRRYDALGGDKMLGELKEVDPESAAKLHPNDKKRIVRALEVYELTGQTISVHNMHTRTMEPRYRARKVALSFADRQDLYSRIDMRVDEMVRKGLVQEVRHLIERGVDESCTSMQAIGYKEISMAMRDLMDIEKAIETIKMESRRYAKRQLSWLRREEGIKWIFWRKFPDLEHGKRISTEFFNLSDII